MQSKTAKIRGTSPAIAKTRASGNPGGFIADSGCKPDILQLGAAPQEE